MFLAASLAGTGTLVGCSDDDTATVTDASTDAKSEAGDAFSDAPKAEAGDAADAGDARTGDADASRADADATALQDADAAPVTPDSGPDADATPPPQDTGPDVRDTGAPDTGDTGPTQTVATPVFAPDPAIAYSTLQSVTIISATTGSTIYYTTNGSTPVPGAVGTTQYNGAISLSQTTSFKAVATKTGLIDSGIATANYTVNIPVGTVDTPTFTPAAGTFNNTQTVALSTTTPSATICYTTDGSAPACNATPTCTAGTLYTTPVAVAANNTTLKAIGCRASYTASAVGSSVYVLQAGDPTFIPDGTTALAAGGGPITISTATTGATLRYTTDNSTPSCTVGTLISASSGATSAITGNTTVKAIACRGSFADSTVTSAAINVQAAAPTANVVGGTYTSDQSVTLTGGTYTCWTTDGSAPACNTTGCTAGTLAAGAIVVNTTNTNLRAVSCDATHVQSNELSVTYVLQPGAPTFVDPDGTPKNAPFPVTLASAGSTEIRYTLAGAAPTCTVGGTPGTGNVVTTNPVPNIPTGSTMQAIGCKVGYTPSQVTSASWPTSGSFGTAPVLAPVTATYDNDQSVTIAPITGATICYTTGGAIPTCTNGACTGSTLTYTAPIPITGTATTVKALACTASNTVSTVTTETYTLQVGAITISDPAGALAYGNTVTFTTSTTGATLHYTLDGTAPTCASPLTGTSFVLNTVVATTFRVIGCKPSYVESTIPAPRIYNPFLADPTFAPIGGSVSTLPNVTISSTSNAAPGFKICYTTDGTEPDCNIATLVCSTSGGGVVTSGANGTTYQVISSGQTIKAVACASFDKSAVAPAAAATYSLNGVVPLVWAPVGLGPYGVPTTVTATTTTAGAKICYTTNSSDPATWVDASTCAITPNAALTCLGDGVAVPPAATFTNLAENTTIRTITCQAGGHAGSVADRTYTFTPYTHTLAGTGANDFTAGTEVSLSSDPALTTYLTWNATNVYLGLKGAAVATDVSNTARATTYVSVYFVGSADYGTGTNATRSQNFGTGALPTQLLWHLRYRLDGADFALRKWNGVGWAEVGNANSVNVISNGLAGSDAFIKIVLERNDVDLGDNNFHAVNGIRMTGEVFNQNGNVSLVQFPATNLTRYWDARLNAVTVPNAASNVKP